MDRVATLLIQFGTLAAAVWGTLQILPPRLLELEPADPAYQVAVSAGLREEEERVRRRIRAQLEG